jgi:integration host factor subunit alpha
MRKLDLIRVVAERTGCSRLESAAVVEAVMAAIKDALQRSESVQIVGFGRFLVRRETARVGHNVRTGEAIIISPRTVVSFKASTSLRRLINRGSA